MDKESRIKDVPIPNGILDDLCCRFIVNLPSQEKTDLIRICFQIEQAHWFYLDFYSKNIEIARPCTFKEFTKNIFSHISYLRPFIRDLEYIIDEFKEYKYSVPTFGAIIIDEYYTHVLVVKSYWSKASWGFPKGKINKDELPHHCAAREVLEETGYDIHPKLDPNAFVDATIRDQRVRLYIIPEVSRSTKFHPQTRHEIKEIKWVSISSIPMKRIKPKNRFEHIKNKNFYMVIPFMRELRRWIAEYGPPNVITRTRPFCDASEMLHFTLIAAANGYSEIDEHVFDDEIECYGGGIDEDDGKTCLGDEIYGIPKLKTYFYNGVWTSRPDMSSEKRNKIKKIPQAILEETSDTSLYEDGYFDCEEEKINDENDQDEEPALDKPSVSENYVDNIEREIISSIEKNAKMEEHENAKNAAYSLIASMNSSTSAGKSRKKSRRNVSFIGNHAFDEDMTLKPESDSNRDIESQPDIESKHDAASKHDFNSKNDDSKSGIELELKLKFDFETKNDSFRNQELVNNSYEVDLVTQVFLKNPIFNKEEFLKKLSENKAIQAMKNFKINKEKLLEILG